MSDPPGRAGDSGSPPTYTRYRSRPKVLSGGADAISDLRRGDSRGPAGGRPATGGASKPITAKRVVKWLAVAVAGWLALSLLLFVISAQLQRGKVDHATMGALDSSGFALTSANTILVLGSDQRTAGTKEPGASTSGPARSDSILLMRVGGGHSARLSIPRDTVAPIAGHGSTKINAAFAFGGTALSVQTIKDYLGISINHVVLINFAKFPDLIDSLGGIDYTGGCVVSKINGGFRNGGFTLRLKKGTSHLGGKQALALARTRHNACNSRENDLTRARRQQKIFAAMKHRLTSPTTFLRLPWVSWEAPQTLTTDMGATSLLGLFGALATSGTPPTRVLRPTGVTTLPDGETALTVSAAAKQAAVSRFLRG